MLESVRIYKLWSSKVYKYKQTGLRTYKPKIQTYRNIYALYPYYDMSCVMFHRPSFYIILNPALPCLVQPAQTQKAGA